MRRLRPLTRAPRSRDSHTSGGGSRQRPGSARVSGRVVLCLHTRSSASRACASHASAPSRRVACSTSRTYREHNCPICACVSHSLYLRSRVPIAKHSIQGVRALTHVASPVCGDLGLAHAHWLGTHTCQSPTSNSAKSNNISKRLNKNSTTKSPHGMTCQSCWLPMRRR